MNKIDLIEVLKTEAGLKKNEAFAVVNLFFNEMSNALANGDRVEIRGLCPFYVKKFKTYTGRNPKTGEQVKIKPKNVPFFKCGKELKEKVDKYGKKLLLYQEDICHKTKRKRKQKGRNR